MVVTAGPDPASVRHMKPLLYQLSYVTKPGPLACVWPTHEGVANNPGRHHAAVERNGIEPFSNQDPPDWLPSISPRMAAPTLEGTADC
jgi:hypothetical protein